MALVGEQPLWYDSFVVDPEAPPFDAGDLPYDYQFHPRELPMAAVLAESAHDDGWTNATTGGVSSCPSPSSSVLTFDGQGEEYCAAPWMDATDQVISHGASTTAVATVLASLAARQAGTGSVTSTCFSFGGYGSRGMAVDGAATQKRPRAHAHAPSQQETTTAKQQCGGDRRATRSSKTPGITPTPPKEPQSLAAKNRRERISERLRELQELVPNGGKVDMVTMLDRAITYVKFMQLQLKVLETDAFWPVQGGKAPEISQVKDALDAIILSSSSSSSSS